MKTVLSVILAGAMIASAPAAAAYDRWTDEWMKAKWGRYPSAELSSQDMHTCCCHRAHKRSDESSIKDRNQSKAAYLKAKLGRDSETRPVAAGTAVPRTACSRAVLAVSDRDRYTCCD